MARLGDSITYGNHAITGDINVGGTLTLAGVVFQQYQAGTGISLSGTTLNVDNPFNPSGTYSELRAQATTQSDVGLSDVDNYSRAHYDGRYLATDAKAADSDKLDGLNSSQFIRLDTGTIPESRLPASALIGDTNTTYSGGSGITLSGNTFNVDNPFNPSGSYASLRAQATTKADVGLGSVRNVSSYSKVETDQKYTVQVSGKSLSDENYTNAEKIKLGNLENGVTSYIELSDIPSEFPPEAHNHSDLYYNKAEIDDLPKGDPWVLSNDGVTFTYDSENNITSMNEDVESDARTVVYNYNAEYQISSIVTTFRGIERTETLVYDGTTLSGITVAEVTI